MGRGKGNAELTIRKVTRWLSRQWWQTIPRSLQYKIVGTGEAVERICKNAKVYGKEIVQKKRRTTGRHDVRA